MILGARTYTVERVGVGSYSLTTGLWADGSVATFDVVGSWQPMSGREREVLPEGYRTRQVAKLFCDATQPVLTPVAVGAKQRADIIMRDGVQYEVVGYADWSDHAGATAHRTYQLAEVGADDEART